MGNNMDIPQKLKIELLYDPKIIFLIIYQEKTLMRKDICTPMFIAVLLKIARIWKQPKCSTIDEWITKMQLTYI